MRISNIYPGWVKKRFKDLLGCSSYKTDFEEFMARTLILSLTAAMFIAFLLLRYTALSDVAIIAIMVFSFVVGHIAFYSLLVLSAESKAAFVDSILPDALRLVSSNLRSGLTVDRALMQSVREEFGPLKDAINTAGKDIATSKSEEKAFLGMLRGVKSESLERAVELIIQGIRSGGQLAGILDKIADVFRNRSLLNKEMRSSVLMYAIFIFFVLGFGAPILFGISDYLIGVMSGGLSVPELEMSQEMIVTGGLSVTQPKGPGVSTEFMTTYFVIALVLSSITGSIVLGQILSGSEKTGLRFIPILITLSVVLFFAIKFLLSSTLGQMLT